MNNQPGSSKSNFFNDEDEDFFEDSFFNNLEDTIYKEMTNRNNICKTLDNSILNVSALSCDQEINGYDKLTGRTWIYPTNYPVRDYQFNIIKAALVKNTLVSLPTGLGKTFIAAVIMYNFYRWYPTCKIVFAAPTRPLVAQQIEACYNICAIPLNDTIEMTGHMQVKTRKQHWENKRVFFATPQVIYNDIKSGICPADKIRCLVFDEAHKARGNYAYCQIVTSLTDIKHKTYRVIALSATPGSKVEDVVNVVKNLHIAHLEMRSENCIDVAPYNHSRKISTVVIKLGSELTNLRDRYIEILDIYARRLKQLNILPINVGNLSKGRVVMLYKEYQAKDRSARHPQHNYIMKDFVLLISLFHGLELLTKHGARVFLNFFDDHPEKPWMQSDDQLTALLERLRDDLGLNPMSLDTSILPDGTIPEIPKDLRFGHPKFDKLKEIMLEHFQKSKHTGQDTRAIVFCEYRESVNLVNCLLLQCRPLIMPQTFVGQGASGKDGKTIISQKQQLRVMRNFRSGTCNTLVATCVAEEGLDVGSVDLILCFDISTRSPIRLVQRCGRTGRERGGQVHILVTEGREHQPLEHSVLDLQCWRWAFQNIYLENLAYTRHAGQTAWRGYDVKYYDNSLYISQTLLDCMRQRDGLAKKVLQSKEIESNLYKTNPRMMPRDHTPECHKMHITVTKKPEVVEKTSEKLAKAKKGQKDIRAMLLDKKISGNLLKHEPGELTREEFNKLYPNRYLEHSYFNDVIEYRMFHKDPLKSKCPKEITKYSTWLEWQRTLQSIVNIGHSSDSKILSEILQYSDAKRFDLPVSTQNPSFTQMLCSQPVKIQSPVKPKETKKKQKSGTTGSPVKRDGDIRALFSTAVKSTKKYTKILNELGLQNQNSIPTALIDLLVELSIDNNNDITTCEMCKELNCKALANLNKNNPAQLKKPLIFLTNPIYPDISLINDIDSKAIKDFMSKKKNNSQELSMDFTKPTVQDNAVIYSYDDCKSDVLSPIKQIDLVESPTYTDVNFDLGNIEDLFDNSSPEEAVIPQIKDEEKPKEALGYFGLDSINDIFADSDDSVQSVKIVGETKNIEENNNKFNKNIDPDSPSILSGTYKKRIFKSPIISTHLHTSTSTPKGKQLFKDLSVGHKETNKCIHHSSRQSNVSQSNNSKSMFTVTQLVDMINNTSGETSKSLVKSSNFTEDIIADSSDGSTSPILLTQVDKKYLSFNASNREENRSISPILTQIDKSNHSNKHSENKSMSPILLTQLDKQNETINLRRHTENKSMSPMILTQLDKKNDSVYSSQHKTSLIILDSDSDNTDEFDFEQEISNVNKVSIAPEIQQSCGFKRKEPEDENITGSPYFHKRRKPNSDNNNALQNKIKNILSLHKNKKNTDSDKVVNFIVTSPLKLKENISPIKVKLRKSYDSDEDTFAEKPENKLNLSNLQIFRRNNTLTLLNKTKESLSNRGLNSSHYSTDSDDDFEPTHMKKKSTAISVNSKKPNKKSKPNHFIDTEAEVADSSTYASGDELTDDSVGSIIDFICDDDKLSQEDMQAHYLQSVKSPVKGTFKIPQLPKLTTDIFSQAIVDQDNAYELDSFCVDSHIGLTQVHDVSELELAERRLESKRKGKKKKHSQQNKNAVDSFNTIVRPEALQCRKRKRRRIDSDSNSDSSL